MGASVRRARATLLAVFLAYLGLAALSTWPLALHLSSHVPGDAVPPGPSTPPLNIWSMCVVLRQLARDPLHLFEANAFYPYHDTLALSEHMFVPALMGAPVWLLTGNSVLAYNVVTLVTLALAGLFMFLLARHAIGSPIAAFAAGALYAFHTWNINEALARLQIASNQWFPLFLLALLRFFDRPSRARAASVGGVALLQTLSCMYWAMYMPILATAGLALLQWRTRLPLRQVRRVLAALAVAGLLALPFLLPYARLSRELGLRRRLPQAMSAERYLEVLPGNLAYGSVLNAGRAGRDAAHFVGFLSLGLGIVGLVRGGRQDLDRLRLRWPLAALVAFGFVLSLGPELRLGSYSLGPGPYLLLRSAVPGFASTRYPERFCLFVFLGGAPLVALGLARLQPLLRPVGSSVVALLVFAEHLSVPQSLYPLPTGRHVPSVYRWLAHAPEVRVVAHLPPSAYRQERADARWMYLSTFHWKRTLQGYTGYFPPPYHYARWRLFHLPSPESFAFLEAFGVDTLVVEPDEAGRLPVWLGSSADAGWQRLASFPEGHVVLHSPRARGLTIPPPPDDAGSFAEVDRRGWRAESALSSAALAIDGDTATAWTTTRGQREGDSLRLRFPAPVEVARVSLLVRSPDQENPEFPTRLQLFGELPDGRPVPLPYREQRAYDRLLQELLYRPREATLPLDLDAPRRVVSLLMRVERTESFRLPWTLPEVRVFTRAAR